MMFRFAPVWLAAIGLFVGCVYPHGLEHPHQAGPKGYDLSDPGVPESHYAEIRRWKVVIASLTASEPVFDNARRTLADRFRDRGVDPVDVIELSGDDSSKESPATHRGLDEAVASLGFTAGDGFLLYLTSHGLPEKGLWMSRDDMDPFFSKDDLQALLALVPGGVPAVVIVSGCFSGQMISKGTVGIDRVLFAASSRRRESFGCSYDMTYTFFDGCFIEGIDAEPRHWNALIAGVRDCVRIKEKRQRFRRSKPQFFVGRAMHNLPLPGS